MNKLIRKWSLMAVPAVMLTGCGGARGTGEAVARTVGASPATHCFGTTGGLVAVAETGECPAAGDVETEIQRVLERTGATPDALAGGKVVFTTKWLECGGVMTQGCTIDGVIVIQIPTRTTGRFVAGSGRSSGFESKWERVYDWRDTFAHELGHVLRERAGLGIDAGHRDIAWWRVVEARSRDGVLFPEDDPRRIAVAALATTSSHQAGDRTDRPAADRQHSSP